ncbi:hypothetical protein A2U01_0061912, partial [Trifolium medium]|nr:hypothetical protein [Trifolium medium]
MKKTNGVLGCSCHPGGRNQVTYAVNHSSEGSYFHNLEA